MEVSSEDLVRVSELFVEDLLGFLVSLLVLGQATDELLDRVLQYRQQVLEFDCRRQSFIIINVVLEAAPEVGELQHVPLELWKLQLLGFVA